MMHEDVQRAMFADNLRRILRERGKRQVDMAAFFGVSKSTVSSWCSGAKLPRLPTIQRICLWLGVDFKDLTTDQPVAEDGKAASIGQRIRSRRCEQSMTLEAICPCCGARMTLKPWRDE